MARKPTPTTDYVLTEGNHINGTDEHGNAVSYGPGDTITLAPDDPRVGPWLENGVIEESEA